MKIGQIFRLKVTPKASGLSASFGACQFTAPKKLETFVDVPNVGPPGSLTVDPARPFLREIPKPKLPGIQQHRRVDASLGTRARLLVCAQLCVMNLLCVMYIACFVFTHHDISLRTCFCFLLFPDHPPLFHDDDHPSGLCVADAVAFFSFSFLLFYWRRLCCGRCFIKQCKTSPSYQG